MAQFNPIQNARDLLKRFQPAATSVSNFVTRYPTPASFVQQRVVPQVQQRTTQFINSPVPKPVANFMTPPALQNRPAPTWGKYLGVPQRLSDIGNFAETAMMALPPQAQPLAQGAWKLGRAVKSGLGTAAIMGGIQSLKEERLPTVSELGPAAILGMVVGGKTTGKMSPKEFTKLNQSYLDDLRVLSGDITKVFNKKQIETSLKNLSQITAEQAKGNVFLERASSEARAILMARRGTLQNLPQQAGLSTVNIRGKATKEVGGGGGVGRGGIGRGGVGRGGIDEIDKLLLKQDPFGDHPPVKLTASEQAKLDAYFKSQGEVGGGGGVGGVTSQVANAGKVEAPLGRILPQSAEKATIVKPQIKSPLSEPKLAGGGQAGIPRNPSSAPIIPPTTTDPVQKIIQALKEAKPIRGTQEALYSKARSQAAARAAAMGEKVPGEQGYYAQLGQLKGELPKVQFEGIRNKLTPEDINSVFNKVEQTPYFSVFEKITAKSGLAKLLGKEGGAVPNKSELALLNEVFPPEFIEAAMGNRTLLQKIWSGIGQVAAVPRSLMAGGLDMSYGLRQGVFSGYSHPKQWASAFKNQFKNFASEKAFQAEMDAIKADPLYKLSREAEVSITGLGKGKLEIREEQFQSALAEKIPLVGGFVKASGRAYTGFANKYRFDMFKSLVENAKKTGDFNDPKFLKNAGELVNTLTGRGSLGKFEKLAGTLSTTLFSPRLLASRVQLMNPQFYMKLQPMVRKEALKSLVGFIAGTTTILGAAKLAGADVGTDMTSSDFGKIKVGNTRIDIMGGFSQPLVLLARILTGKVTSSTTGKIMTLGEGYKAMTRFDMIQRFFESKEAPIVSFITSAIKGQNAIGEPFNLPAEVINRMIPMFISDMVDLYKDGGLSSLPLGIPAFFGAGAQTYGRTEMVTGVNQIGQPTSQVRPIQGIGETITEKLFGRQPLGSSSTTNVKAYYEQMLKMPREEAAAKFNEIAKTNPDLAKKIVQVVKDQQSGITIEDEVIKAKGVANGDRAIAIRNELNKLTTREEKARLWSEYVKKKIITEEVAQQLVQLLQGGE